MLEVNLMFTSTYNLGDNEVARQQLLDKSTNFQELMYRNQSMTLPYSLRGH